MASDRSKIHSEKSKLQKKDPDSKEAARVILKNLVYVIGLPESIASEKVDCLVKQILMQDKYYGQYGKIEKIVVNKERPFSRKRYGASTFSAYITYSDDIEASLAILVYQYYSRQPKILLLMIAL